MQTVEIDLRAITYNLSVLAVHCQNFMPVLKADAYGHGLVPVAMACMNSGFKKNIHGFAVGTVEEGVELRKAGITLPIYSLLGLEKNNARGATVAKLHNIIVPVHNKESMEHAFAYGLKVALKLDTGMHRLGFSEADMPYILDFIEKHKDFEICLVFSHLAMADGVDKASKDFTKKQGKVFNTMLKEIMKKIPNIPSSLGHSAGTLLHNEMKGDIPRLGIGMYGSNPFYKTELESLGAKLKPAMHMKAPVLAMQYLKKGESIGYGQVYTAQEDSKIAVVAVGYADMYRRVVVSDKTKKNQVQALYKNTRVPLVGKVCMQMSFFDVTGTDCSIGDELILLGGKDSTCPITPDEMALWWNTIPYEVTCLLGKATPSREYI